jgi:hypothetical protein
MESPHRSRGLLVMLDGWWLTRLFIHSIICVVAPIPASFWNLLLCYSNISSAAPTPPTANGRVNPSPSKTPTDSLDIKRVWLWILRENRSQIGRVLEGDVSGHALTPPNLRATQSLVNSSLSKCLQTLRWMAKAIARCHSYKNLFSRQRVVVCLCSSSVVDRWGSLYRSSRREVLLGRPGRELLSALSTDGLAVSKQL